MSGFGMRWWGGVGVRWSLVLELEELVMPRMVPSTLRLVLLLVVLLAVPEVDVVESGGSGGGTTLALVCPDVRGDGRTTNGLSKGFGVVVVVPDGVGGGEVLE